MARRRFDLGGGHCTNYTVIQTKPRAFVDKKDRADWPRVSQPRATPCQTIFRRIGHLVVANDSHNFVVIAPLNLSLHFTKQPNLSQDG